MARRQTRRRKEKKNIEFGVAHINSTFNNTIIVITDKAGNAISWSALAAPVSKVPERVLLLPLSWLLKPAPKKQWSMVCAKWNVL